MKLIGEREEKKKKERKTHESNQAALEDPRVEISKLGVRLGDASLAQALHDGRLERLRWREINVVARR